MRRVTPGPTTDATPTRTDVAGLSHNALVARNGELLVDTEGSLWAGRGDSADTLARA
jgi:hypothetical protein